MKKLAFIAVALLCTLLSTIKLKAQAGDDRLKEIADAAIKEKNGWAYGAGFGLDFAALNLINPRVGAGQNRLGFGGLGNVFANYKEDKLYWNSRFSSQLAIQRIGGKNEPFLKNLDRAIVNSKAGRAINEKWAAAVEAEIESQLTPTYEGNFLSKGENSTLIANVFSPAIIRLSPGLDYKATKKLTFFFAPASIKGIVVMDDTVAQQGRFIPFKNDDGTFKKSDWQFGGTVKVMYNNKVLNDKMVVSSTLDLFSNYLRNPQNIDVQWHNEIGWTIWKGLALNWVTDVLYDDDIQVQVDRNNDGIYGSDELGKNTTFISALLLKYNLVF